MRAKFVLFLFTFLCSNVVLNAQTYVNNYLAPSSGSIIRLRWNPTTTVVPATFTFEGNNTSNTLRMSLTGAINITGDGTFTNTLRVDGTGNFNSNISVVGNYLTPLNLSTGVLNLPNSTSNFSFRTNGVERLRIEPNGFIGVLKGSASFELDVNGTANATSYRIGGSLTSPWIMNSGFISNSNGAVIGMTSPRLPQGYKLAVAGKIIAEELNVRLQGNWPMPDYVFEGSYELMSLDSLHAYVTKNKHLPEVPSAKDVAENGLDVAAMEGVLLKKVEEMTLYIIELKKRLDEQQAKIEQLEQMAKKN